MSRDYDHGWNDAVAGAAKRAMDLQAGFRKLLKDARTGYTDAANVRKPDRDALDDWQHRINEGEAVVGALGDVIRNIAALKRE